MQLYFKTNNFDTAARCAMSLVEGRQNSHEPLTTDQTESWVAERFPNLTKDDQAALASIINAKI
jgi:hypothetical protein